MSVSTAEILSTATIPADLVWYNRCRAVMRWALLPWMLLAFVALFAFDAPGSEQHLEVWLLVAPIWSYPLVAGICMPVSSWLKHFGRHRGATIALVPPALLSAGYLAILAAFFTMGLFVAIFEQTGAGQFQKVSPAELI